MNLNRILAGLQTTPWAITQDYLNTMIEVAMRENESLEAVATKMGRPLENTYEVSVRDGVATVPVNGPLFRYANLFTQISGATSYQILARDFAEAVDDPAIKAIVLDIDSPGGDVNGNSEFAGMVYAAREKKPVIAYVGGTGASAAYMIASAATRIVVADTGQVGSVGVVYGTRMVKDENRIEIVSSQSPYKRVDPSTEEGRSRIQSKIDEFADVFISNVAKYRGVTPETVLSDFGQGDILIGKSAVDAGMADEVGTYEGVIESLTEQETGGSGLQYQPVAGQNHSEETTMETVAQLREKHGDLVAKIEEEAKASVEVPDVAAAEKAAADSERERVLGIITCEAATGREKLAMSLAKRPGMTAEDAVEILAEAPAAKDDNGSGFAAAMRQAENPDIKPDPDGESESSEKDAVARSIELGKSLGIE